MEHSPVPAAGAASAAFQPPALPPEAIDSLAIHGLRELLFAPIPKVARALAGFNREQLGIAIEIMVAMLDAADPDPEAEVEDSGGETVPVIDDPDLPPAEDEGDPDLEETGAEDSFMVHHAGNGPGCAISDMGGASAGEDDEEDDDPGQCTEDEISTNLHARWREGAGCTISDGDDAAYAEWHTLPAATRRAGDFDGKPLDPWRPQIHEDAEDDDPSGCWANEDDPSGFHQAGRDSGPGCEISDSDFCLAGDDRVRSGPVIGGGGGYIDDTGPGEADDAERWQQTSNVPMEHVLSAEHNIFTDQRVPLGLSNLMTSFQTNGGEVRSADTAGTHVTKHDGWRLPPGVPV